MENEMVSTGQVTVVTKGRALDLAVADALDRFAKLNPDAKLEAKYLGLSEEDRNLWGITVLSPSVTLTDLLNAPGLELQEIVTKRTGRFARTLLIFLTGEAPYVSPEAVQHQAICERMDVDALLIVGVKRPGEHRPEQGEQTLIGIEHTGLELGEMHGITARLMNDVNSGYLAEQQLPPFPPASTTGQSGGKLFAPKPKKIITSIN